MKQSIINFLKRWSVSYILFSALFALICIYIKRRLNLDVSYLKVFWGAAVSAVFCAGSISLFRMRKGNTVVKILLGLFALLPAVFVMRRIFGVKIFRFGSALFIVGSFFALIYGIVVTAYAVAAKRQSDRLNDLLKTRKKQVESEKEPEKK
jgi:hypothetical protein